MTACHISSYGESGPNIAQTRKASSTMPILMNKGIDRKSNMILGISISFHFSLDYIITGPGNQG